jgi:hypothetical protein
MTLMEYINSEAFELYTELLNKKIAEYEDAILTFNPELSKIQFSAHDVNRKVLQVLKDIRKHPLKVLEELKAMVQTSDKDTEATDKLINKVRTVA